MPTLKLFHACLGTGSMGNEIENEPYNQCSSKAEIEAPELEQFVHEGCKQEETASNEHLSKMKTRKLRKAAANTQKKLATASRKPARVEKKPANDTKKSSNVPPQKPARRLIKLTRFFAKTVTNVAEEMESENEEQ